MIPASNIVNALKADPGIASLVSDRVYDHDVREAGWEAHPEAFDGDRAVRPLLCVADGGSVRSPFDGPAVVRELIDIYGFVARTPNGRTALATLMGRVEDVLYRWQDPTTGAMLFVSTRSGRVSDGNVTFDRYTFSAGAVLNISRW